MDIWDDRAKLPHGVYEIRRHLAADIDNVPLLVPILTDAMPASLGEMFRVMQEHGEVRGWRRRRRRRRRLARL